VELYEGMKGSKREVVINTEWGALGNTGRYPEYSTVQYSTVQYSDDLMLCSVSTLSAPGGT